MTHNKTNGLVTILTSANTAIISVAVSLLEEASIEYSIKTDGDSDASSNEHLSRTEIQVSTSKAAEARNLLADLEEINFEE